MTPPIPEIIEGAPPRKKFTRQEYERLLASGAFEGQRLELIDGELFDKLGQNPPHAYAIQLLTEWLASFLGMGVVRVQLPLEVLGEDSKRSLPEPDFVVLKHRLDLGRRHPRADEITLAIEIAETSAPFDLTRKAALYARAGVPEYWVLDLGRRMMVVHREPDGVQYRQVHLYSEDEFVSIGGRTERVRVGDILPAA